MTTCVVHGHVVITAVGEIDIDTAPKLREQVATLVGAGHYHLILDLERVEFMDSTGLSCLMSGSGASAPNAGHCAWCAPAANRSAGCSDSPAWTRSAHATVHNAITATDAFV